MYNIVSFSRNRSTSVEQTDSQTIRASCRLQDTLQEAFVEIMVRMPDLEITDVRGGVIRIYQNDCDINMDALQRVIGTRIGPGILKIIKGLIGEAIGYRQLAFMVEECCHAVILSFTKEELINSPRPENDAEAIEYYASMVRENIRLYNRCAAFAPGSAIIEKIELPT